jgi:hypothetical protein
MPYFESMSEIVVPQDYAIWRDSPLGIWIKQK